MRELRFRAWIPRAGWQTEENVDWSPLRALREDTNQAGYIWSQYTGLKDKNGKEIYEGDILSVPEKIGYWEVDYIETRACFALKQYNCWAALRLAPELICDSEVIGNIYENPDLLEELT